MVGWGGRAQEDWVGIHALYSRVMVPGQPHGAETGRARGGIKALSPFPIGNPRVDGWVEAGVTSDRLLGKSMEQTPTPAIICTKQIGLVKERQPSDPHLHSESWPFCRVCSERGCFT